MFGYIQYDKPNLYIKDFELYRAMYCGVCKGLGAACGQIARLGLSYDAAFFSAILHNIKNEDVKIERQSCITKFGFTHPMALPDGLTEGVACLNTVLVYYKLSDDVADEKKGGLKRRMFRGPFGRAKKKHPAIAEIVDRNMRLQAVRERENCTSVDIAADATAVMLRELSDYLLGDSATPQTGALFYDIGKWIYLMDAADDYDEDVKKGRYNPFAAAYGCKDKAELQEKHGGDLRFLFNTLFYDMREQLSGIRFHFNRDLTDNILLRGLPMHTERIVFGTAGKGKACKAKNKEKQKE